MSERVLHEWIGGRSLRLVTNGSFLRCQTQGGPATEWVTTAVWESEWIDEFARLVARVRELEEENAKLRKCVEAADKMRANLATEGWRSAEMYDAARAEVKP